MRVNVVGAGITGLTLSYELLKRGFRVFLTEKEQEVGGQLKTFPFENSRLEYFYHHFFTGDTRALELLTELNLSQHLSWREAPMGFFKNDKLYPFSTPLDILRFRPLSLKGRLSFGITSLKLSEDPDWKELDQVSVNEWGSAFFGKEVYETIWQPLLRAKFGEDLNDLPAAFLYFRILARKRCRNAFLKPEKLAYLKGSFQLLIDSLVLRIKDLGGEFLKEGDSDLKVLTTPAILPENKIKFRGNICLVLKLKQPLTPYYWINVASPSFPFCVVVEHTNAFDDPLYGGYKVVYLSNYLSLSDPLWNLSDQEIAEVYLKALRKIEPNFEVVEYSVFREKYAQPVPARNHFDRLPSFNLDKKTYFIGSSQIYPNDRGISDSINLVDQFLKTL